MASKNPFTQHKKAVAEPLAKAQEHNMFVHATGRGKDAEQADRGCAKCQDHNVHVHNTGRPPTKKK